MIPWARFCFTYRNCQLARCVFCIAEQRASFLHAGSQELYSFAAKELTHLLDEPPTLPAGIASSLKRIKLEGTEIGAYHKQRLFDWFGRVQVAKTQQTELANALPVALRGPASRITSIAFGPRCYLIVFHTRYNKHYLDKGEFAGHSGGPNAKA